MKNNLLLISIQEIDPHIVDIRNGLGGIEIKLKWPQDDRAWIPIFRAPSNVEKRIKLYLIMGGEIE